MLTQDQIVQWIAKAENYDWPSTARMPPRMEAAVLCPQHRWADDGGYTQEVGDD